MGEAVEGRVEQPLAQLRQVLDHFARHRPAHGLAPGLVAIPRLDVVAKAQGQQYLLGQQGLDGRDLFGDSPPSGRNVGGRRQRLRDQQPVQAHHRLQRQFAVRQQPGAQRGKSASARRGQQSVDGPGVDALSG